MLHQGANVLIFDEPIAVLTLQEARELFHTLRRVATEGHTVIFIFHKLGKVISIPDPTTILCNR